MAEETFGAMLRRERTAKGLTLRAVAAAAGVSLAYVSDVEQDRRYPPREAISRQIAAAIGLDPEEFIKRADWWRVPRVYRERIEALEAENARLNAAAPLLLKALEGLVRAAPHILEDGRGEWLPPKARLTYGLAMAEAAHVLVRCGRKAHQTPDAVTPDNSA